MSDLRPRLSKLIGTLRNPNFVDYPSYDALDEERSTCLLDVCFARSRRNLECREMCAGDKERHKLTTRCRRRLQYAQRVCLWFKTQPVRLVELPDDHRGLWRLGCPVKSVGWFNQHRRVLSRSRQKVQVEAKVLARSKTLSFSTWKIRLSPGIVAFAFRISRRFAFKFVSSTYLPITPTAAEFPRCCAITPTATIVTSVHRVSGLVGDTMLKGAHIRLPLGKSYLRVPGRVKQLRAPPPPLSRYEVVIHKLPYLSIISSLSFRDAPSCLQQSVPISPSFDRLTTATNIHGHIQLPKYGTFVLNVYVLHMLATCISHNCAIKLASSIRAP
ncbi:hypothetical protein NM688_g9405 [Phlebia brevispora]|uniref:Uncharacterized protein n=1 Tax=Phlebia brevispora TaxID=194682 RepID=A0ACC1RIP9_9APHY|nr:hypothetical protein NM688_g9405 [Phlebia brevispora]